jgi:hypothetical protein
MPFVPTSGSASATGRTAGAALTQLGGTDNDPTGLARPRPADIIDPLGRADAGAEASFGGFSKSFCA